MRARHYNCSTKRGALSSRNSITLPTRCRRVMTDADCFKAVRKLARANAKLLRQQRVLEADLIDAQLTILKQQAQLEAAAIANAGAKDAAQREVAARRELDAERAARADDALQAAQRLHDREAQLRHEADSRRRADAEALAEERRRRGDAENRLREWKARAAQVTQLARHRVARATAARASAQARCAASSGDDETTFSPSQPDFPEPPDPYIDARAEFFPRAAAVPGAAANTSAVRGAAAGRGRGHAGAAGANHGSQAPASAGIERRTGVRLTANTQWPARSRPSTMRPMML